MLQMIFQGRGGGYQDRGGYGGRGGSGRFGGGRRDNRDNRGPPMYQEEFKEPTERKSLSFCLL